MNSTEAFPFPSLLRQTAGTRVTFQAHLTDVRPVIVIDTREQVSAKAVLATLSAIGARFDVPVVFCPSPEESGRLIESWAFWCARELVENVNELARATKTL